MRKVCLLMTALVMGGCALHREVVDPAAARASVGMAAVSVREATVNARAARAAVEKITASASREAQPALKEASQKIETVIQQLDQTSGELVESALRVDALQTEMQVLKDAAKKEEAARHQEEGAKGFWRGCTLKLTALTLGLGLWIFKGPLLRGLLRVGVPVL